MRLAVTPALLKLISLHRTHGLVHGTWQALSRHAVMQGHMLTMTQTKRLVQLRFNMSFLKLMFFGGQGRVIYDTILLVFVFPFVPEQLQQSLTHK